ncbi:hypothetical protein Sango_1253800 [Sesamum angolense]|uniref:Aminotransferase-like plant mobile domain-containing protein n=1 Tax=Sesamum angolense TaxID=2727404 RepID=A0AAE1WRB4_9LAMI|nr:hypothetical protein Sango_1253800 [Sesamum angolense]
MRVQGPLYIGVKEILEVLPSSSMLIPSPVIYLDHSFEFLGCNMVYFKDKSSPFEISLSKNIKAWTLRATHHEPPRHQPSDDFAHLCTLGCSIIEGDAKWDGDLHFTGEFRYTKGYWEWTKDVLSRCGDRLRHLKIYDVVYASLFTYDHNSDIVKVFCEAWCPLTNTLLTFAGEMSILLWDLHELAGLSMTGCLYDEVVLKLRGSKMTRFSREGGAKYYEPREARKQIHKAEFVSWACNMLVKDGPFKFVDDGHAEELDHSYFVAIHSSYLTLRQGGRFIIEPYSPHRFGLQFGYDQDLLGTLRYDTRVASLEERLRYWRLCILSKSSSKVWFPCLPVNAKKLCSEAYKAWWAKVHGTFFDDNVACLIRPKSIKITLKRKKDEDKQLEDEVQSINVGEESETSHSSTMTPPLGMGFRRNNLHLLLRCHYLKVRAFFSITKKSSFKVRAYDEARSLSFEKLSRNLHEQQLKEVKARLQDIQAKASEEASEIQSAMDELEHIEEDIVVLKGRRTNLRATLKEKKQLNHDTQAKVHEVEKDLAALESTGPLDDVIVENLESSRANLGILKEDLKSLNPFA